MAMDHRSSSQSNLSDDMSFQMQIVEQLGVMSDKIKALDKENHKLKSAYMMMARCDNVLATVQMPALSVKKMPPNVSLPKFSGEYQEDIHSWWIQINMVFSTAQVSEGNRFLHTISLLQETAASWFMSKYSNGAALTWEQFGKDLFFHFEDRLMELNLHDQLFDLKQNGDIGKYVSDFQKIVSHLDTMSTINKVAFFQQGLYKWVHSHVHSIASIDLLEDNIQVAQAYYISNFLKHPGKSSRAWEKSAMQVSTLSVQDRQQYMHQRLCFKCGSKGHKAKYCNKKPAEVHVVQNDVDDSDDFDVVESFEGKKLTAGGSAKTTSVFSISVSSNSFSSLCSDSVVCDSVYSSRAVALKKT